MKSRLLQIHIFNKKQNIALLYTILLLYFPQMNQVYFSRFLHLVCV